MKIDQTPSTHHTHNTSEKGMTLLELTVVLILISILSTVAILNWPMDALKLQKVRGQLEEDIRLTQGLAMYLGEHYRITFSSQSYQISGLVSGVYTHPITHTTVISFPSGFQLLTPAALLNNYLEFDGKGVPYVATNQPLSSQATFTLKNGPLSSTLSITPETGRLQ